MTSIIEAGEIFEKAIENPPVDKSIKCVKIDIEKGAPVGAGSRYARVCARAHAVFVTMHVYNFLVIGTPENQTGSTPVLTLPFPGALSGMQQAAGLTAWHAHRSRCRPRLL